MTIKIPDIALPSEAPAKQPQAITVPDIKLPDIKLPPAAKSTAAPAEDTQPEGSWADVIGSALTNLPDRLQKSWQGLRQGIAVKAADMSSGVRAADATSIVDAAKQGIESASAKLASLGYSPTDFDEPENATWDQKRERNEKFRGLVDKLSLEQLNADPDYQDAKTQGLKLAGEIAANTPHTKDWSAKDLVSQVLAGASDMGPAMLAGVITRSPTVALGTMTPQAYGTYYQDSLAKGLNPLQADSRATLFAALEPITEALPVGLLMRKGAGRLTDLGLSSLAEGAQEAVTQAIQNGYDIGALDEKMTVGQFLSDVAKSGVVGAGAGGVIHTAIHAPDMIRGNTPETNAPTVADEVRGAAQQQQAPAVPEGEYDAVAAEMGTPAVPDINLPQEPVAVSPERYAAYKAARDAGAAPQDALDSMQRDVQDAAANIAGGDALDSLVQDSVQPRDATSALRYGLPEMQIPAYLRQQSAEVGDAINQAGAPAPLDLIQQQVQGGELGLSPQEMPQNLLPAPGQTSVIALPGEVAAPVVDQPQRPRFTMRDRGDERAASRSVTNPAPAITIPEILLPASAVTTAEPVSLPDAPVAPQTNLSGIQLPEAGQVTLPNGQTVTARPDADVPGAVQLQTEQGRTVTLPAEISIPDIKLPEAPAEPVSNVRMPKQNNETFDVGDQFQLAKKVGGLDTDMPYTVRERYGDALVLEGADKVPRTITETQLRRAMVVKGLPVQEEPAAALTEQDTPTEVTPPKSMASRKTARAPRQTMAERKAEAERGRAEAGARIDAGEYSGAIVPIGEGNQGTVAPVDRNTLNGLAETVRDSRRSLDSIRDEMRTMATQADAGSKALYEPPTARSREAFAAELERRLSADEITLPSGTVIRVTPSAQEGRFDLAYGDGKTSTATSQQIEMLRDGIGNPEGPNGALLRQVEQRVADTRTPQQRAEEVRAENERQDEAKRERERADANPEGELVGTVWEDDNGKHTVVSESRGSPGIYRTDTGKVITADGIRRSVREQAAAKKRGDEESSMMDFIDKMPPMQKGRFAKTLRTRMSYNGQVMSRHARTEMLAKENATAGEVGGKPVIFRADGETFSEVTKAEQQYLEHLKSKNKKVAPSAEEKVTEYNKDAREITEASQDNVGKILRDGRTVTGITRDGRYEMDDGSKSYAPYVHNDTGPVAPSVKKQAATGMKPEALTKAYEDWSEGVKGLENVRVSIVPRQADIVGLPEGAPAMMAFYDPSGVHMVAIAENINTPEEAHAQFRHELVAHYGLRARLSKPEYDKQMDRILAAEGKDKRLDQYFKEVRDNYGDIYDLTSPDGQRMIAEEVVASVAENAEAAQRIGVIRQVMEAIRKMLVKSGMLNDRATFNDVVDLVKANSDFIRQNYVDNDDVRRSIAPMRFQAPDSYAPSLRKDRRVEEAEVPDHIKEGMRKVLHAEEGSLTETINGIMDKNVRRDAARATYQYIFDDLAPIADLEKGANAGELRQGSSSAYKMASNSRQINSIIAAAMTEGVPTWSNGAVVTKKDGKGLLKIFDPIARMKGNQLALWEYWAGAVRGKRLMAEGRENLYTQQEIDDVIAYVNGKPELRKAFNLAHKEYQEFKKDLLDFAEQAGTIDPEARALWDKDDYVPLYRVADDADKATAPGGKSRSFVNQSSGIKTLKGGTGKVDIMNNIFQNASHLITSSYNNRVGQLITELADGVAMQEVPAQFKPVDIQNGEMRKALNELGVSTAGLTGSMAKEYSKLFQLAPPAGKDIVSVMFNGKRKYYQVTDPGLMRAINQVGPRTVQTWMKVFTIPKQILTRTVTSTPDFVIRNLTRDILGNFVQQTSMAGRQGVGQILADSLTLRPIRKALAGAYKTFGDAEQVKAYRAAGGFSGGYDNARPDALAKQLRALTKRTTIGSAPRKAWEGYEHFLNAGEMGTRLAVFDDVMKKTGDITEATYQANDVLNFSRRGDGAVTNFLMNSVPFMNARIQGLDRLARGAKDNFGAFVMKGAMISAATMALMAMNKDDERYWALNEAVRDNYWIIPTDNGFVQVPKPFEVGSLFGTVLERAYEAASRDDKVFWDRMSQMFLSTFAMNPIPQSVSPIVQDIANKDFFMDRPIVSEGMKFKDAPDQFDSYTPEFIKSLTKSLPDSFPEALRSPVRLQHLLEGYTGSMGQYVMSAADTLYRDGMGMPDRPARAENDVPGLNIFLKPDNKSSKYITRVYEMQEEVRKANAKLKDYREARDRDGVLRTRTEKADELAARKSVERSAKKLTDLSKESRKIMEDGELTAAEKRTKMDAITVQKNAVAKEINDRWWRDLNK